MDQALDEAGGPDAVVRIAFGIDDLATLARDEVLDVLELRAFTFLGHHFIGHSVLGHASGVVQGAEDQIGRALVVLDHLLLHLVVDVGFLGGAEARAHVDAFGTQGEGCHEAACITEAAGGDHRDLHLVGGSRDEDQAGDVILAGMTRTFETVDGNRINAHALSRQGVADGGAFVDDLDAVFLEVVHMLLRLVARGLNDLDAAFDDGGAILRIGRRLDGRQDRQVHTEGLVGHFLAAGDLLGEIFRRRLGKCGDEAEAARIGDGGHERRLADPLHATLDDGMFDAEHLRKACLEHGFSLKLACCCWHKD